MALIVLVERVTTVQGKPMGHTLCRCHKCRQVSWIPVETLRNMPARSELEPICRTCVEDGRLAWRQIA